MLCARVSAQLQLMNSMVLTSGEVTGLSQDSASKQDAVDGEHRKQIVRQAGTTVSEKELLLQVRELTWYHSE